MPAEGGINMRMLFSDIKMDPKTSLVNGFKYEPEKFPGLKVENTYKYTLYCCRLRLWLFFAIASRLWFLLIGLCSEDLQSEGFRCCRPVHTYSATCVMMPPHVAYGI